MNNFIWKKGPIELIGSFSADWASKTTAISAGKNLTEIIGQPLWNEITKPTNKNKYFIKPYFASTVEGTDFQETIESYNILSNTGQKVYFSGGKTFKVFKFEAPSTTNVVEASLMVGSDGEVRFYVIFGTALNTHFRIKNFDLYKIK